MLMILLGSFGVSEVFKDSSNHLYPYISGRSSNKAWERNVFPRFGGHKKKKVDLLCVWCPFAGFSLVSLLCLQTEHSLSVTRFASAAGRVENISVYRVRSYILVTVGGKYLRLLSKVMHPTLVIQSIFAYSVRPCTFRLWVETSPFTRTR